jgi:hypothetical protein
MSGAQSAPGHLAPHAHATTTTTTTIIVIILIILIILILLICSPHTPRTRVIEPVPLAEEEPAPEPVAAVQVPAHAVTTDLTRPHTPNKHARRQQPLQMRRIPHSARLSHLWLYVEPSQQGSEVVSGSDRGARTDRGSDDADVPALGDLGAGQPVVQPLAVPHQLTNNNTTGTKVKPNSSRCPTQHA